MNHRTLTAALVLCLAAATASAQSTAFTYQGQVVSAGVPASGLHDMRFRLFDAATGGTQIGTTQCVNNVTVINGVFTTTIDFGQQFATTGARFIEIDVRPDTGLSCSNTTGFTLLAPRQPLTAAPLANHAKSAFSLAAADGSPANAVLVDNAGNVGIGVAAPATTLDVLAPSTGSLPGAGIRIRGFSSGVANLAYMDFLNGAGTRIGYVGDGGGADNSIYLQSDTGNVHLNTAIGSVLSATANGNVGIGTPTPSNRLHLTKTGGVGTAGGPAIILQDTGVNSAQSGYIGFWNSSPQETGWIGYGTPGSPHMTMLNARSGGDIFITPAAGRAVKVPVLEITGADLAEKFPASEPLEPGTVVAVDRDNEGKLCISRGSYNRCVAGVVSGANNFSVGAVLGNLKGYEDAPAIALSGRVYVKCDATNGAIEPGDLLTTSDTPGHAMKATDQDRSHGTVIGKAMGRLKAGEQGLVLVLVNLQ